MKKVLKYFEFLLPAMIAFGMEFVVAFIALAVNMEIYLYGFLLQKSMGGRSDISVIDILGYVTNHLGGYMDTVSVTLPVLWIVTFFLWYRKLIAAEKVTAAKEKKIKLFTVKNVIIIAIVALGMQLVIIGAMDLILPYFKKLAEEYTKLMEEAMKGNPFVVFLCVVILAPFSEELIFRGVIMKKARVYLPFIVANLMQAALFSIFHMNIVQGAYTFPVGLIMGYIAYKYKSIKASILFHMAFNALSYVLLEPTVKYMMIIYIISGIILAAIPLYQVHKVGTKNLAYSAYSNND